MPAMDPREVMRERLGLPAVGGHRSSSGATDQEFERAAVPARKPPLLPPSVPVPCGPQPPKPALLWSCSDSSKSRRAKACEERLPSSRKEAELARVPETSEDRHSKSQAERPSSAASSPRVLLGRLHGVWQHRARETDLKKHADSPGPKAETSGTQTAQTSVHEQPYPEETAPRQSLLKAAAAALAASSAQAFRIDSRASASPGMATPRPMSETKANSPRYGSDISIYTPIQAFTRLRTRGLEPMPDTDKLIGAGHAALLGHGLLWQASFQRFAVGWMPGASLSGACLGVAEFGRLLREHGVKLDYEARCKALELAAGKGSQALDFQGFIGFVHATAQSAAAVSPPRHVEELLSKQELSMRRKCKRPEEVAMSVLRAVFNSYDLERTGSLAREEYFRLLRDRSQVPKTIQDLEDLSRQLAYCREDYLPGPLNFMEFARFLTCLNGDDITF